MIFPLDAFKKGRQNSWQRLSCKNVMYQREWVVSRWFLPFCILLLSRTFVLGPPTLTRRSKFSWSSLQPLPTTCTLDVLFSLNVTPLEGLQSILMTPELPALLTPESSGLLSSGFFLEKELVLANFGRDSNGDSVFLLEDDKIYKNKQTISSKKISYQKLNSHSRNYFQLFLALKISDKKQHFQRIACKYLSIFFFSFIFRIF